jgi:hypothetical protein
MCDDGHGFRRMQAFNFPDAVHTIDLVYWNGNHYDFLLVRDGQGNPTY